MSRVTSFEDRLARLNTRAPQPLPVGAAPRVSLRNNADARMQGWHPAAARTGALGPILLRVLIPTFCLAGLAAVVLSVSSSTGNSAGPGAALGLLGGVFQPESASARMSAQKIELSMHTPILSEAVLNRSDAASNAIRGIAGQ